MDNAKTIQDYREIAAGWEEDVRASEVTVGGCIEELSLAWAELQSNREHLAKIRALLAEMERLESVTA